MAQLDSEIVGDRKVETPLLNTFPRPAKAKHIKESMMSFFILH